MFRSATLRRLLSFAVGGALVATTLSACSSAPSATTGGLSKATLTARKAPCLMITPADIKLTTGETVRAPQIHVTGLVTSCNYLAAVLANSIVIQHQFRATLASFAATESNVKSKIGPTTPVTGIGTEAFSFSVPSGTRTVNSVVTLVGSLQSIFTGTCSMARVEALAVQGLSLLQPTTSTSTTTTLGPTPPSSAAG